MSTDPLRQVLDDCAARLAATEYFADIAILPYVADSTEDELAKRLGAAKGASGKVGACVLVLLPVVAVPSPNLPGPQFTLKQSFVVLEHPELNRGSIGTKKPAGAIAREVVRLFHHAHTGRGVQVWNAAGDAVVPETGFARLAGYTVTVSAQWGQESVARLATPTLSAAGSTLTITHADPAATLCYTTDGSYPWAGNPSATSASAGAALALAPASSCVVRVAAYRAGYQSSSIATATVTVAAVPPASPG